MFWRTGEHLKIFLKSNLDYILLGLSNKFIFQLLAHLRIEELVEGTLDGQHSLLIPLLHLVTEFISIVKLLNLIKVGLISIPEHNKHTYKILFFFPHNYTIHFVFTVNQKTFLVFLIFCIWLNDTTVNLVGEFYPLTPTKSMHMSIMSSPSSSAKHIFRNWSPFSSFTGLFFKYLKEYA